MSQQINLQGPFHQTWRDATATMSRFVSVLLPAHHVQAAAVYQCSELMYTDLCGVEYSLDVFQTSLELSKKKKC